MYDSVLVRFLSEKQNLCDMEPGFIIGSSEKLVESHQVWVWQAWHIGRKTSHEVEKIKDR